MVGFNVTAFLLVLKINVCVLYILKDASGKVIEVRVNARKSSETEKPKAFIHWVASPLRCSVRLYERL